MAAAVLLRALLPVLAITVVSDNGVFHAPDTVSYLNPARSLIAEGRFWSNGQPDITRTPGYPIVLTPGILLGHVEWTTIIVQIALSCLSCLLVHRICRLLFRDENIAIYALALYCIEPLSMLYCAKLLSETAFTFTLLAACYCFLLWQDRPHLGRLALSALCLTITIYIRPIGYYLPLVWTVVMAFALRGMTMPPSRKVVALAVFLGLCTAGTQLWNVRNHRAADWYGFSTVQEINLYFNGAGAVLAHSESVPLYEKVAEMGFDDWPRYFAGHPEQRGWALGRIFRHMRAEALRIIADNPMVYAKIHVRGMVRMLLEPGAVEYLRLFGAYPEVGGLLGEINDKGLVNTFLALMSKKPLVFWSNVLLGALLCVYLLLALVGVLTGRMLTAGTLLPVATLVYFTLLSGSATVTGRFRHALMPFVCMAAAVGLNHLMRQNYAPFLFSRSSSTQ